MIKSIFYKYRTQFFLGGIFLLSAVLRFYYLGIIPAGFHKDEASYGYNAYSLLKTGHDEFGVFLPFFLRLLDMWAPALYSYITIPFVAVFGLTEFAVRLPTTILGLFFIPLVYLLVKELTHNKSVSLLSAFLIAISPAQITLSRVQSDPLVTIVLICLGLYLFLLGKNKKRLSFYILAFIFWLFSLFGHYMGRTFVPMLFFILMFCFRQEISSHFKKILTILFLLFIVIPTGLTFLNNTNRLRYNQLSIFQNPGVQLVQQERITEDKGNNVLATRFFHNKISSYTEEFLQNYFSFFSYDFLFTDKEYPTRETIPAIGMFYVSDLFLFLLGIYIFVKKKQPWLSFLLFWILVTPLAPAFAVDETPNIHRFLIAGIPIAIIIAYGIINVAKGKFKNLTILFFAVLFACNLVFYLHQYYVHQERHMPWFRDYGYKEMVNDVSKIQKNYSKVYVTKSLGGAYIFFLFYQKYDPLKYQLQGSPRDNDYTGFENLIFIPEECPLKVEHKNQDVKVIGKKGILYINNGLCEIVDKHMKLLKKIGRQDGTIAFQLLEYKD